MPKPQPARLEDRWILSGWSDDRVRHREDRPYDFAHAAQEIYSFLFSELCDWYFEIAKPRLYEGEEDGCERGCFRP